jgi:hypothetical protein
MTITIMSYISYFLFHKKITHKLSADLKHILQEKNDRYLDRLKLNNNFNFVGLNLKLKIN